MQSYRLVGWLQLRHHFPKILKKYEYECVLNKCKNAINDFLSSLANMCGGVEAVVVWGAAPVIIIIMINLHSFIYMLVLSSNICWFCGWCRFLIVGCLSLFCAKNFGIEIEHVRPVITWIYLCFKSQRTLLFFFCSVCMYFLNAHFITYSFIYSYFFYSNLFICLLLNYSLFAFILRVHICLDVLTCMCKILLALPLFFRFADGFNYCFKLCFNLPKLRSNVIEKIIH